MMTLRQLAGRPPTIPTAAAWSLAELAEYKGRFELYSSQSPQVLATLRENALVQSAIASNRIEGVEIDRARIGTVIFGRARPQNRNEEEIRAYREALKHIHEGWKGLRLSDATIRRLHRISRGESWDAGRYKQRDIDITETFADGRTRTRFRTLSAVETPKAVRELCALWQDGLAKRWLHPICLAAAFNLDFLCIHPFRDGNGRVSRLLLLLQAYQVGHQVGRYVSLERLIEEHKDRYYETLEQSSFHWHEGRHDPWPYINFLLFILGQAYRELRDRAESIKAGRGSKTELIIDAVNRQAGDFSVAELKRECPGVSLDMIRRVLKNMQAEGAVKCLGRGRQARWKKKPRRQLGSKPRK